MNYPTVTTIEELAQFLEALPDNEDAFADYGFDMGCAGLNEPTYHPCGTAACIGGWACVCARGVRKWHTTFFDALATLANVDADSASFELGVESLCYPTIDGAYSATPAQGASALREWARNGNNGYAAWKKVLTDV